jgi:acyl-CoA synthetase (NDP forming)
MLAPNSVAVIGAGRQRGGLGHEIVRNLVAGGFDGPVYPVNAHATHVASMPTYPRCSTSPIEVDLAIIAVPAPRCSRWSALRRQGRAGPR